MTAKSYYPKLPIQDWDEEYSHLRRMVVSRKMIIENVAKRYNVTPAYMEKILTRFGLKCRVSPPPRPRPGNSPKQVETPNDYRQQEKLARKILSKHGVDYRA